MTTIAWRKSSRSSNNGSCVEVGCLHNATWRKSSRSSNNGSCVEVADVTATVAIRDSKLPTTGTFPVLIVDKSDWLCLTTGIRTGTITS